MAYLCIGLPVSSKNGTGNNGMIKLAQVILAQMVK